MCDDKKDQCQCGGCGDCGDGVVTPAPAFDMFAPQPLPASDAPPIPESADDAMARAIIESIEKIAKGIITLQQEIALLSNCTPKTVRKHLKVLRETGLITEPQPSTKPSRRYSCYGLPITTEGLLNSILTGVRGNG